MLFKVQSCQKIIVFAQRDLLVFIIISFLRLPTETIWRTRKNTIADKSVPSLNILFWLWQIRRILYHKEVTLRTCNLKLIRVASRTRANIRLFWRFLLRFCPSYQRFRFVWKPPSTLTITSKLVIASYMIWGILYEYNIGWNLTMRRMKLW